MGNGRKPVPGGRNVTNFYSDGNFQMYFSLVHDQNQTDILQIYDKAIIKDKSSKLREDKNILSSDTNREFSIFPNVPQMKKH